MLRILGFLIVLGLLGGLGLIGYAYSGYLVPEQTVITEPVTLDAQ